MQKLLQNHSLNTINSTNLMCLDDEIADTPATRQIAITLANAAWQVSSTTRVSSCANCRCRYYKDDLKCSIKVSSYQSTSRS
ncbi:hypothetical protein L211DRAFT_843309 [Terfezia boudieri ATCC MYA-4762]|uniref:Uncharacterized protein n=1 Tax=Terfezia boudieri ATCC MYA-4762 TaxID=1051890 RepID=A0A3N4LDH9_9PEZI|nr:hypothetical protein L211DRAFT_843309 [Terfezia boudieri ATCC MYA-4762]